MMKISSLSLLVLSCCFIVNVIAQNPPCAVDADCTEDPNTICHPTKLECVACTVHGNCPDGGPWCLNEDHCVECLKNWHCPDGLSGCVDNVCVECSKNVHCDGFCDETSNTCVECKRKTHCPNNRPCIDNACAECATNNHCPDGVCSDNTCVQCIDNDDCPQGICVENTCVECIEDSDCAFTNGVRAHCTDQNLCVGCLIHAHCEDHPNNMTKCQAPDTTCVQCLRDSHCGDGEICDRVTGYCVGCVRHRNTADESECIANDPSTPYCHCDRECYQCLEDHHCPGQQLCEFGGTCAGDPNPPEPECDDDTQCTDPDQPYCNGDNACVACTLNRHCPAGQRCSLVHDGECVDCIVDGHCGEGLVCDKVSYTCKSCYRDSNCVDPDFPYCQGCSGDCVECTSFLHCLDGNQDCYEGSCVPRCNANAECSAPSPRCHPDLKVCVECFKNSQCSDPTPYCDFDHCVGCKKNSHCGDGECVDGECV